MVHRGGGTFLRFEVTASEIVDTYYSAPYEETKAPAAKEMDKFTIDLKKRTVTP